LTAIVFVGWFWAQYWTFLIAMKSFGNDLHLIQAASRLPTAATGNFSESNDFAAQQYGNNQR
tara:strand:- start:5 stop:190 length:186 start_codon:yes stop_codon:yes gene_type:complete